MTVPNPQSQADCSCDFLCSGQAGCIACWVYPGCIWQCYTPDGGPVYSPRDQEVVEKVGLDRHVNLRVRNVSLGEVGKLLARLANAEIYVPAGRIDERRDVYLEDVSLEVVVRELELMAVERP